MTQPYRPIHMCNVGVGCESNHSNCVPAITTDYVGQYYSCYLREKNLREKNKSKISRFTFLHLDTIGVKWGPLVATAWRVLGLQVGKTASGYGQWMEISWTSNGGWSSSFGLKTHRYDDDMKLYKFLRIWTDFLYDLSNGNEATSRAQTLMREWYYNRSSWWWW